MQKLYFELPTSEAFLKIIQPLWSDKGFSVCLIGHNDLADDLASAASLQGVAIERSDIPPVGSSEKTLLLIFTEKSGEELSGQLLSFIDVNNVVVVAPVTDWHFSQKPLFLVSIPKAGTHLIYELVKALGYYEGVEVPEFPEGQTWYCIEYTNSHTVACDFFVDTVRRSPFGNRHHCFMHSPALFIYRHPLDILISEAHYDQQDGKTTFAGWFDGLDFDGRVACLLNDNWLVGSLRERIGGFLPWLNFPNVISLSFEELIGAAGGGSDTDQLQLIWSIQLKLQVPGDPSHIAAHLFNPNSATFRSGQLGGYKKELPAPIISDFLSRNEDILTKLGYPTDGSIGLPMNREFRRKRNIRFSQADYENMPVTIESDFLGCNLVRYSRRIFAIPIAAGSTALETLPADVLSAIPSAHSLSEIKTTLLIGNTDLSLRRQSLDKLAKAIRGLEPISTVYKYWMDDGNPRLLQEVYFGFNLIAYDGQVWAAEMSAGPIDFANTAVVEDWLVNGSLLSATTVDGAYAAVDRLLDRRAFEASLSKLGTTLDEKLTALASRFESDLEEVAYQSNERLSQMEKNQQQSQETLAQQLALIAPESDDKPRLLEEGYHGYNLISYAGQVWAAEIAAGPIDLTKATTVEEWLASGQLLFADTVDGVYIAVDQHLQHLQEARIAEFKESQAKYLGHINSFKSVMEAELCFVNHEVSGYVDAIGNALGKQAATDSKPKNILLVGDDLLLSKKIAKNLDKLHGERVMVTHAVIQDFEPAMDMTYDIAVLAEPNGEILSGLLLKFVDYPMTLIAPITEHHITRRGIYVITIPKSGSHMLYQLLEFMGIHSDHHGYIDDMASPQPGTWKSVSTAHTHLVAPKFIDSITGHYNGGAKHPFFHTPVIFMYRNPRDILISESHYYVISTNTLSGYFLPMNQNERLCLLIEGDSMIAGLNTRLSGYLPWLKYQNIIPVSFEELVGERGGGNDIEQMLTIWSLQIKLHIPGSPFTFSQQMNGGGDKSATFRKGQLGEYKNELSEIHWNQLHTIESQYMPEMGYSMERDYPDPFPAHRDFFRHRPLTVSALKNESGNVEAILLHKNFHGFNLIASEGKIWALDILVGDVDFSDTEKLDNLTASEHLLLLKADTTESAQIAILSKIQDQITATPELDGSPRLLKEDYYGFNLIAYAGYAWALDMTAGKVDLGDTNVVEDLLAKGQLLRTVTVDGLCSAVDRLLDHRIFEDALSKLRTEVDEKIIALTVHLENGLDDILCSNYTRILEEDYFGYNLILHARQVWAAKMAAGPLDFADAVVVADWLTDGRLLRAATLDGARVAVGRLLDRQAYEAGLSKLGTLLEKQLLALAARLESGLEEAATINDNRLNGIEARLEQCVDELERSKLRQRTGIGRKKTDQETSK